MTPAVFLRHVNRTRSCWLWTGNLGELGYGRVRIDGHLESAHRVAYTLWNRRRLRPTTWLRNRCGDRSCVRPDHWQVVRIVRFTPEQIAAIQRSGDSHRDLADAYGVSYVRIWQIRRASHHKQ